MSARQLHLNVNILTAGFFNSAWRATPQGAQAFISADHYVRVAQAAERGTLDAIFLADVPAITERPAYRPFYALEPTVILAAVARATSHIGLIATASTSYNEPYNIARRFASLDLVSGGRAGLNVVTTADPRASRNFGFDDVAEHGARYERAGEFADVVKGLWNSWEDGAFVGDQASGVFADENRIHDLNHVGRHYRVQGALNVPRSPQGHPVIVQAGGSDDGRELAARHAEAVFSVANTIPEGKAFADDIRARAARYGRRGDEIVILPGLATVIGATEEEARRREDWLWSLVPPEFAVQRVAKMLGVEPETLDLDQPLPGSLLVDAKGWQTFSRALVELSVNDGLTVRQLIRRIGGGIGHRLIVGTPEQIADDIAAWFHAGAADGFNLMPDVVPDGLDVFVDEVVPLLRRKGIFREAYAGSTLRAHFGLARPAGRRPELRRAAG
ncbi:LLM class flavin-dependent oxidoreductase [Camelimonas lactis]|uniref:FMN-dependent oxidoreductase (Nitrilotriacetate monooxygenase family) n=1 Tax=Camelimonas lactis TaxID=659006 RepID=A0A4R2GPW7_9HYPH|nr:LLM class flavin-dependent oxidoreductase [Camelimonas lactis]TCO11187.1 FMN-dependent oxidoreductase (nitrilotriacetate monooxygenase family) [Camelimonas lactis]